MALAPRTLGDRGHVVLVDRLEGGRWIASIDGRTLPETFPSEGDARAAAAAERFRLDGISGALLRRLRRGLRRKQ
jgi:hypothetical protein